jgi:folate-binding protein YgfZ
MDRITNWHSRLAAYGARVDSDGLISDFGDRTAELGALGATTALVPLTHIGVIEVSGDDAQAFLNTQLTSDLTQVTATAAQYSGYCTPKGRLLATFVVCLRGDNYLLMLPRDMAESVVARLQRYVLRAKVKVEVVSDHYALLGLAGPQAQSSLAAGLGQPSPGAMQAVQHDDASVITLPGNRYLVICSGDQFDEKWTSLSTHATPAGAAVWELQGIRTGIGVVTTATQEAFIPQMFGLEIFGGVSFEKGCYPGQEIVARTQYLGNLKRSLYYGRSDRLLAPGDTIVNTASGKTVGTVTNAAPAPDDWEFLAVLQREALETGTVFGSTHDQTVRIERPVADLVAGEHR